MSVVAAASHGGPEVLVVGARATPAPGADEVLVRVAAAGINRPDILQRKGLYPPPPGVTEIPGLEIAGTIVGLGPGTRTWRAGDRVCALVSGGGYAEYCVASGDQCLPVPRGMSMAEAASLPETFFTVWSNVFDRAVARPGESLLVHGGASGIGVCAIQLAHASGLRVFATAGSVEKCVVCERLGAERAINYRTEDFVTAVKALTEDRGVDVILDMVGGDYVSRELQVLADDGRLVFISYLRGREATVDIGQVMRRRLVLTGSTLRSQSIEFKAAIARSLRRQVWPLLESGRVRPVVHAVFPLEQAAQAHVMMESGMHIGKIVLQVTAD
ncbi:MAG: NAD(P)H-quinone oxidoreductase [Acidiferrobacterales bacterium]